MNIALEIKKIQNDLENLNDENLIKTIKELLNFAKKKSNIAFKPFSIEEYKKERSNLKKILNLEML